MEKPNLHKRTNQYHEMGSHTELVMSYFGTEEMLSRIQGIPRLQAVPPAPAPKPQTWERPRKFGKLDL